MLDIEHPLRFLGLQPGDLSGYTAVVTGAGRGIGRATAVAFAWLGAKVVIAEQSAEGIDVEREIQKAGGQALFIQTDVSDEVSVTNLLDKTRLAFGEASILVNNAILCPVASVVEMEPAEWDRVIAVNLRGGFLTCRAFLPGMLEKGSGTIVNMISTEAMPHLSAYIASKQGLAAFSQSLAGEVGEQGVNVIAFAPGFVNTPGLQGAARRLAPRLGFSEEGFLNMSLHPAYEGAMPVADAAAATVYLVVKKAVEHHGEVANGYEILEQAGYLSFGRQSVGQTGKPEETSEPGTAGETTTEVESGDELNLLLERLVVIINETETEFERLPIFVRPLAKRGFKGKAGLTTIEWRRLLSEQLEVQENQQGKNKKTLVERLPGLAEYYYGVPAETARFTKDAEFLGEVERISTERIAVIHKIEQKLNQ